MRLNNSKSKFFAEQIEYLGYWINKQGIQPKQPLILRRPKQENNNQLRQLVDIVNYYCNMWFRRSELLAMINGLASHQKISSLNGTHPINRPLIIKKFIGNEVLISYPDFNMPLLLYTDASDHQLGAVIMQDRKPIALYSRNINTAQKRYTTTERNREMLSAIETFKEYKNILLGYPIIVFTDHKNDTFNGLKASDHV
jgi:hypothetical protein